jgi:cysteine desulfurase
MGAACRIAAAEMSEEGPRIARLRARLWAGLETMPGVWLNGDERRRVPGILNVSIEGVEGESLLLALSDLAVSSGSACASLRGEPSYVLRALGRNEQLAQSSLRISLGRYTTAEETERAAARIRAEVERLRAIAPPLAAAG